MKGGFAMLLKDYIVYWYQTYRKPKQQRTTQIAMENLIQNHIVVSKLGEMELSEITTRDIQEFLTNEFLHGKKLKLKNLDLRGEPLSAHTITKLRQLLIAMFKQAVHEEFVIKNVAENTEPISIPWHDSPIFTPEIQRKFLAAVSGHRFYVAYILLFYLGCRRGEVLGLAWDAVDFRHNTIKIRQTLIMENGSVTLKQTTKTKSSLRTIPIPMEIKAMLAEWRKQQREESRQPGYKNEYNLVFANKDGSPHNPAYFSRNFKAMVRKLDFCSDALHVHSARHSWATNMVQLGIGITDIQAVGGWSRPDTLLNIYAHTVKDSQRKALKKLYKELT